MVDKGTPGVAWGSLGITGRPKGVKTITVLWTKVPLVLFAEILLLSLKDVI